MKLIFLGPPGAGKGTLAKMICAELGIVQVSTGDLFRQAVKDGTELGKKVKAIMDRGELVPDQVTLDLVRERLARKDVRAGYLLDGFPRTIPQAEGLKAFQKIDLVVDLQAPDEVLVQRLTGRETCPACGKIYHVVNMPPKVKGVCDVDGATLVVRGDDTIEAVRNRLAVYRTQTQPLIEYYERAGIIRHVDSSTTPEATLVLVRKAIGR